MRLRRTPDAPRRRARIARPLTAAAAPVRRDEATRLRKLSQPWQQKALGYYDTVPECWYPAQFYARTLAKVRFFPAVLNELGEPEEATSGPLLDLWQRIQGPGGGTSELASSYGRLQFLIGDGYLVTSEQNGAELWEYLSPLELRIKPDERPDRRQQYLRYRAPGATPEELIEAPDSDFEPTGKEADVFRLWRRHPAYSEWADSPVHAVLELYELLTRLTAAAGAESTSRAATRGGFYLPDEVDFRETDAEAGGSENTSLSIFNSRMIEAIGAGLANPGSAEAMMPIVVTGPGFVPTPGGNGYVPIKEIMGAFPIGPERDFKEMEAMDKVIARISFGLDLPAEFVTSTGDANHWSGWLLDDQGFRLHAAPVCERFGSDLNTAYLRPAAVAAGVPDAERVVVGYDAAEAVNHPDETKTALEAWGEGIVSSMYVRDKIGATEDDAPSDEDKEWLLTILGKSAADEPVEDEGEGEMSPAEGGQGGDTDEVPPELEGAESRKGGAPAATVASALHHMILGAAEQAVTRARELSGSRIVSYSNGCDSCKEQIRDVPLPLVASSLGPEGVREIIDGRGSESGLVLGAGESLASTLRRWGVNGEWPEHLGEAVEKHALRTLYEPSAPPLPPGFSAVVTKALQ